MRICASLGKGFDAEELKDADMIEIRTDLTGIPDGLPDITKILTFKGNDISIPNGFEGIVDIGEYPLELPGIITLCSYHDHSGTPDVKDILGTVNAMRSDIVKAVYTPRNLNDLNSIYCAATSMKRKHVMFGMTELGTVTRIRQDILGNEFTFAHSGTPTAEGQLSVSEMKGLEDCMITGIIGHPLNHSLSPEMHNAAFKELGMPGIYLKFDTPDLNGFKEFMVNYGIRGVNVTIPYKTEVIEHLDSLDKMSERIGAVNTVTNVSDVLKGSNTDVHGIERAFLKAGVDIKGLRVLMLGSGGAARACAYFLNEKGCGTSIVSRNPVTSEQLSKEFGTKVIKKESIAMKLFDVVINCTPIGMHDDSVPIPTEHLDKHVVFDMIYGKTKLKEIAEKKGCTLVSGKDMLISQGSRSFETWTERTAPECLMRSVI
jgi:shikimate 5-dehydrogenase